MKRLALLLALSACSLPSTHIGNCLTEAGLDRNLCLKDAESKLDTCNDVVCAKATLEAVNRCWVSYSDEVAACVTVAERELKGKE